MSETLTRLQEVFREVFQDPGISVDPATTSADIEGWDSLMHVTLVLQVERQFGIRFSSAEVASLQDVGDLIEAVESRTSGVR